MTIPITEHPDGCVLPVRAQPGARNDAVLGEHGHMLKVAVTAPARDGRANAALTDLLRKHLGIRRSEIRLLTGETAREKRFLIRLPAGEVSRRLAGSD